MTTERGRDHIDDYRCHISDGELMDEHRVGCEDLCKYDEAIEALDIVVEDTRKECVADFMRYLEEELHYDRRFVNRIESEFESKYNI